MTNDPSDPSIFVAIVIGGTFYSALMFFTPLWGPSLLFYKLGKPKGVVSIKGSFTITDVFVLIFFLSPVNAAISMVRDELDRSSLVFMLVSANSLVALVWLMCVRFLARYQIQRQASRLAIQLLIYPISIFCTGGLIVGTMMLLETLGASLQRGMREPDTIAFLTSSVLLVLACIGLCYGARRGFAYLLHVEQLPTQHTS
jgi:hypothetical protein